MIPLNRRSPERSHLQAAASPLSRGAGAWERRPTCLVGVDVGRWPRWPPWPRVTSSGT